MTTYDVENTNGKNKGRDLQLVNKRWALPEEQKECRKEDRGIGELLNIDQNFLKESKTRQKNLYGVDWLQNDIWSSPVQLEYKLSRNDIRPSHKILWENHGNLENGIENWRVKLSWSEDPEGYIQGRCTITITIWNSDYAA